MRALILLGIILVCAGIALRRPYFGALTFVWLGFFNPQSMTWGGAPLSMIMALATVVGYMISSEPKRFPLQSESLILVILWGLFGITTMFAIYPDRALRDLILVSKILLMVFLCMCLINSNERLHSLVRVIALSLGFYALKGLLFVVITGGQYIVFGPTGSFLEANNMIGLALNMNLPLLVYLMKTEEKPWLRWTCRAMFFASYPSVVFTYSRGAWLGLVGVTALIILRSRYKFRILTAGAVFAIFLLPVVIAFLPDRLGNRYEDLENYDTEQSAQMRFGSWTYCWRVASDLPIIGGGFNHYSTATYDKYFPEFLDQYGGTHRWRMTNCHSAWFTVLSEHGFPGFFLWVGLMGCFVLSTLRIRYATNYRPEMAWMHELSGSIQISLAAYVVVGTFIDAAYFDMLYYLIAMVVVMKERLADALAAAPLPTAVKTTERPVLVPAKTSFGR
jgi:probable O-glycosylation ligase (exosortase A-associated)